MINTRVPRLDQVLDFLSKKCTLVYTRSMCMARLHLAELREAWVLEGGAKFGSIKANWWYPTSNKGESLIWVVREGVKKNPIEVEELRKGLRMWAKWVMQAVC